MSNTKAGLTPKGKHMQFTKVAFCCHGNWFVAGDQLGQIYQFDMAKNRSDEMLLIETGCITRTVHSNDFQDNGVVTIKSHLNGLSIVSRWPRGGNVPLGGILSQFPMPVGFII